MRPLWAPLKEGAAACQAQRQGLLVDPLPFQTESKTTVLDASITSKTRTPQGASLVLPRAQSSADRYGASSSKIRPSSTASRSHFVASLCARSAPSSSGSAAAATLP